MASRVTKPCPGCHTTEHDRNKADEVCYQCQRDLAYAKAERARQEKAAQDSKKLTYEYHERAYATPRIWGTHGNVNSKVYERFRTAWFNVIMRMASPATGSSRIESKDDVTGRVDPLGKLRYLIPMDGHTDRRDWVKSYDFSIIDAEAILEMHKATEEYIKATDQAAYEKGQNLLLNLASGGLSMKDFNEQATRSQR